MAFILVSLCSLENALRFDTKKSKFLFAALTGFPKTTHINVYSSVLELRIEPVKLQEELTESNRASRAPQKVALPCQYIMLASSTLPRT